VLDNIGIDNSFAISRIVAYNGENRIESHNGGDLLLLNIEDLITHSNDFSTYLNRIYRELYVS